MIIMWQALKRSIKSQKFRLYIYIYIMPKKKKIYLLFKNKILRKDLLQIWLKQILHNGRRVILLARHLSWTNFLKSINPLFSNVSDIVFLFLSRLSPSHSRQNQKKRKIHFSHSLLKTHLHLLSLFLLLLFRLVPTSSSSVINQSNTTIVTHFFFLP